jgi:Tol biopolymer transport system component
MKLFRSLALLFGLILVLITTVFEISRRDAKIPSAWLTFNVMTVSQTLNYNYSGPIYWALPDGDLWRMRLGVGQYACLRWSPDGRQMLFGIGGSAVRGSFNYYDINRVYANGSHVQRLISFGPHSTNDCPAWSPDGKWIAFTGSENGVWGIYRMHPDGSDMQLVNAGNGWDLAGRPILNGSLSWEGKSLTRFTGCGVTATICNRSRHWRGRLVRSGPRMAAGLFLWGAQTIRRGTTKCSRCALTAAISGFEGTL